MCNICSESTELQKHFNNNKEAEEKNVKLQSKILYYTKLYVKMNTILALLYPLKSFAYRKKMFSSWTWKTAQFTVTPYYQMIVLLEMMSGVVLIISMSSATVMKLGLIVELSANTRILKEGIKAGMLRYALHKDKDEKCMELLIKSVIFHNGIIK